jgi:hypothetical protein
MPIPNAEHYSTGYLTRRAVWADAYEAIADTLGARFGGGSVVDVGCAAGHLVEALRRRGFAAYGVDGAPEAPSLWPPAHRASYAHLDLTAPDARLPATDGVLCLEVAEHLPEAAAVPFVALLVAHRPAWVVLTSAPPGAAPDPTHLNEQPYGYWRDRFAERGYALDAALTCSLRVPLRRHGGMPFWYVRNLFAYRPAVEPPWRGEEDWIAVERRFLRMDRVYLKALAHVRLSDVDAHLREAEALLRAPEPAFYVDADGRIVVSPATG